MAVVFSILGVAFMLLPVVGTLGIPGNSMFPPPEAPENVFPYLFLLYLAAGTGWFMFQRSRSSKIVNRMERSIAAIHARFNDEENL